MWHVTDSITNLLFEEGPGLVNAVGLFNMLSFESSQFLLSLVGVQNLKEPEEDGEPVTNVNEEGVVLGHSVTEIVVHALGPHHDLIPSLVSIEPEGPMANNLGKKMCQ